MIGYPITYGDDLTQEQANKRLKEVQIGAMVVIGLYLLWNQAAYAADGKTPPPGKTPSPGQLPATNVCPAPPPNTTNSKISKELLAGFASVICSTAVNTSNFWIGVMCGLVVVAGMQLTSKS